MTELVDHSLTNLANGISMRPGDAHDRSPENRDLVGQGRQHVVPAVGERDPSIDALSRIAGLMNHPAFEAKNPNRLRALVQGFASGNPARFHDPSGAGYRFLADRILETDAFNPMTAARMIEPTVTARQRA